MKRASAALLAMVGLLFPGTLATADPGTGAGDDVYYAYAETSTAGTFGGSSAAGVSTTSSTSPYTSYESSPICNDGGGGPDGYHYGCGGQSECGDGGLLYNGFGVTATGEVETLGTFCDEPGDLAPEQPGLTLGAVLRAFQRIPLPESRITVQPPGGKTLVNLPTVMSTEAEPFTRTVTLLGNRIGFAITPASFTWRHGDGTQQTTTTPGVAHSEGADIDALLTHTYLRRATVQARVDTLWTATFTLNGGPPRPVPGVVSITGDPAALEVLTARPQLTG